MSSLGSLRVRLPLVFLAGIVGVPWQDIARKDAQGKPDLLGGLDSNRKPVGGFMSARELSESVMTASACRIEGGTVRFIRRRCLSGNHCG